MRLNSGTKQNPKVRDFKFISWSPAPYPNVTLNIDGSAKGSPDLTEVGSFERLYRKMDFRVFSTSRYIF